MERVKSLAYDRDATPHLTFMFILLLNEAPTVQREFISHMMPVLTPTVVAALPLRLIDAGVSSDCPGMPIAPRTALKLDADTRPLSRLTLPHVTMTPAPMARFFIGRQARVGCRVYAARLTFWFRAAPGQLTPQLMPLPYGV